MRRRDHEAAERRLGELIAATLGKRCPRCGVTGQLALVYYGERDPELGRLAEALERGDVVLGSTGLTGDDPLYRCRACGVDLRLGDFED
ncbi:MAG: hypothetical protein HY329_12740 [Chloroflexi bacterium]|nr:hypothetical protein [Chloroflexota bacterium]